MVDRTASFAITTNLNLTIAEELPKNLPANQKGLTALRRKS
jgi:hypothetical protein